MAWSELPTPTEVTVDFSPVETDKVIGGVTVSGGTVVTPESLVLKVLGINADGSVRLEVRAPKGVNIELQASVSLTSWTKVEQISGQGSDVPIQLAPKPDQAAPTAFWRIEVR
jgi:sRNA-binding carbon storage regulator CsrA